MNPYIDIEYTNAEPTTEWWQEEAQERDLTDTEIESLRENWELTMSFCEDL